MATDFLTGKCVIVSSELHVEAICYLDHYFNFCLLSMKLPVLSDLTIDYDSVCKRFLSKIIPGCCWSLFLHDRERTIFCNFSTSFILLSPHFHKSGQTFFTEQALAFKLTV